MGWEEQRRGKVRGIRGEQITYLLPPLRLADQACLSSFTDGLRNEGRESKQREGGLLGRGGDRKDGVRWRRESGRAKETQPEFQHLDEDAARV